MRRVSLLLLLTLVAVSPLHAASTQITLQASAQQISSGNGSCIAVPSTLRADVTVEITAASGTTPALTVWLEACKDQSGSSTHDLVANRTLQSTTSATANTAATNVRNIVSVAAATGTYTAQYDVLATAWVRPRWVISGTTPQFTFAVYLDGK